MKRRNFLTSTAIATSGLFFTRNLLAHTKSKVFGHNEMKYTFDRDWGTLNSAKTPVNDCHEMVQDARGRILLLTNETRNNVIIYDKSGKLMKVWGSEFPGAHGLSIQHTGKEDYLFITDTNKHQVYKTSIDGKKILTIDPPSDLPAYKNRDAFVPTETAVLENGEFYVADGYGAQHILHYDEKGRLKNSFGGKGEGDQYFDNAHGICVDYREDTPTLLITDRTRNAFKRFSLDGKLLGIIYLPGACVCRPVIKGDYLYAAVLRSPSLKEPGSGFVSILNKQNKVVSNIGGCEPVYKNGNLQSLYQTDKIFVHPHDVCVDEEGSIYVAQWSSGKVYPFKFSKV